MHDCSQSFTWLENNNKKRAGFHDWYNVFVYTNFDLYIFEKSQSGEDSASEGVI